MLLVSFLNSKSLFLSRLPDFDLGFEVCESLFGYFRVEEGLQGVFLSKPLLKMVLEHHNVHSLFWFVFLVVEPFLFIGDDSDLVVGVLAKILFFLHYEEVEEFRTFSISQLFKVNLSKLD